MKSGDIDYLKVRESVSDDILFQNFENRFLYYVYKSKYAMVNMLLMGPTASLWFHNLVIRRIFNSFLE